jgi:hypothetical protein
LNKSALYVNGTSVPIVQDIAIQISYLIAELRHPDTRNANFTKKIFLPSVGDVDRIFEFCFEVNLALQTFNPNLKTPVSYRVNNTEVLKGNLQLLKISLNKKTRSAVYECKIVGLFSDLFYALGESYLYGNDDSSKDLDFSEYDHVLDYTNVTNTWDPAVSPNTMKVYGVDDPVVAGYGYRYPLIDYGLNGGNIAEYYAHHLRPGLFAFEYLMKIFAKAGKTFESTFLDSLFFRDLMIPCVDPVKVPQADIESRTCVVGTNTGIVVSNIPLYYQGPGGGFEWDQMTGGLSSPSYPIPEDDFTLPYIDLGNIYNTSTGEITIPFTSQYVISADVLVTATLKWDSGSIASADYVDLYCSTHIQKWDGASWTTVANSAVFTYGGSSGIIPIQQQQQCSVTGLFTAGTKFRLKVETLIDNALVRDNVGALIITGNVSYDVSIEAPVFPIIDCFFRCNLLSDNVFDGDTMEVNRVIPTRIKQKDFLKGIINMFNLYLDIDKDDPNKYIIEPRDLGFYTEDIVDWTEKEDIETPTEITPASQIGFKRVNFKYTSDADYYNKTYEDIYKRTYGYNIFQSENEFTNDEKNIEIVFSPTPLVGNDTNRLIIPKIYKNEDGTVSQQKANIRILQWRGAFDQQPTYIYWTLKDINGSDHLFTKYPYAGHLDDPYTPALDLCFGVPYEVYYKGFPFAYTTNNLYTVFHQTMYDQMDNKDCKLVVSKFVLTETDIKEFDFRKKYKADGSFYRVLAINNFDLLNSTSTQVELLKIL